MDFNRVNELGFEKTPKWYSIILVVSVNEWWNIFIVIQCGLNFLISTYILGYRHSENWVLIFRYLSDLFYAFEIICSILYRVEPKIRRMKYVETRGWTFILIDIFSIIPIELFYYCHHPGENPSEIIQVLTIQNRGFRIYRVIQLISYYETLARKTYHYIIIFILQYILEVLIVGHVLSCMWVMVDKSVSCDSKKFHCLIWNEFNLMNVVFLNWSGQKETFRNPWERVIVSVGMLLGFFIVFAHFYPKIFYFSMQIYYRRALYYGEFEKLQAFFRNMIHNSKLRGKILHRFNDVWTKGQTDPNLVSLLKNIPLALKKEISTDIYWESLRHSELFREVSRNCKRSLSLLMATEYYHAGEVIYYKEQEKVKMIFIVRGILQIMAEENENFPVISFSSGTVLGEMCLFFFLRSQVILKCAAYCELQVLAPNDVAKVLRNYPKDKKLVFRNLNDRLTLAKSTEWRKQHFSLRNRDMFDVGGPVSENTVKWIKAQWAAIWEINKRHLKVIKAKEEGSKLSSWKKLYKTKIKIDFMSNYLDLVVLSDTLEEKKDFVCYKTTFPWSLNPSTQFLRLWYYVVLLTSLIPALIYPAFTGWTTYFPRSVYHLSFIVTLIFLIDVTLKIFTAVETDNIINTRFSVTLRHLLLKPTFYFDIIAAFPYQLFVILKSDVMTSESYEVGLYLHPAIFKSYVLMTLNVPLGNWMDKITVFKNCLIYILLLYWTAEIIQLIIVRKLIPLSAGWIEKYNEFTEGDEILKRYTSSLIIALITSLSIPDFNLYPDDENVLLFTNVAKYGFFFFMSYFLIELYGVITVKIHGDETFQVLIKRIVKFIEGMYVTEEVTERLLKSLYFQWEYDRADYLTSKISIVKTLPLNLRKEVYLETMFETLKLCPMFDEESVDFMMEVLEKSYLVAIPKGSVLITFAHISHILTIIHRGYCQVNSYLTNDVVAEIGRSAMVGTGTMFPLLSSFCSIPSPISVITVTDCEAIMIQLDDFLSILMKYNLFKDLTETLKELDLENRLKDIKPGLLKIDVSDKPKEMESRRIKSAHSKMANFMRILYFICPKRNIFSRKFYNYWDLFYNLYLIVVCWLWPCCFGLFLKKSHIIVPVLTVGKGLVLLHLIFRFYLSYYNKKGLLITHPIYTCWNYLGSTFILDLIRVIPAYQIYLYGFASPYKKPDVFAVLILSFQLLIKIYNVMDFLSHQELIVKNTYFVRMLKITIMLLLMFNFGVNFLMFMNVNWIFEGSYHVVAFEPVEKSYPENRKLLEHNSLIDYYVFTAFWILCSVTTNDYINHEPNIKELYFSFAQSFFGTIGLLFFYAWVASNSIFSNIRGTIHQEKLFSFISSLKYEKADDLVIERVNAFYNYEWSQAHGESLKKLCEHLPTHLHEELLYPIYRSTFSRNRVFAEADEGFYKSLAIQVKSVFFNRGSVIIFQNEVQSNIFIIHKGKCFVYDWFEVLENGSIVGDIQRTGLMQNKVYALTHVEMLRINSENFFSILNAFDILEADFLHKVKNAENFLKSEVWRSKQQLRPVDSKDALNAFCLKKKNLSFEDESIFEDPENSSKRFLRENQFTRKKKHMLFVIYPGTWKMKAYLVLYFIVTFMTVISFPIFSSFGGLTAAAFITIGITDLLWIVIILLTFHVGVIDSQKGDVVTDFKIIAKKYLRRLDGFPLDIICAIPFEVVPVIVAGSLKSTDGNYVTFARAVRLFRGHYFLKLLKSDAKTSDSSFVLKHFFIILIFVEVFFLTTSIYVAIATEPSIVSARNHHELNKEQFFAFVLAFEYVINFISSANLSVIVPDTKAQLHFFNLCTVVFLLLKSILINQILSYFYVSGVATAYYKSQLVELEAYLYGKDTSPCIIKEVLNYRTNLLRLSRSENMPSLLNEAPVTIRMMVMKDIFIEDLISCPLFQDVDRLFLDQLIARGSREFYFAGQKIVEQGDVDSRMYFIHSGEVYIISQTKDKAYVEYVVRIIKERESFGEPQGLWLSIPHSFTYRARTLVDMLVIHSDNWADLRSSFPDTTKKIFDKARALRYL